MSQKWYNSGLKLVNLEYMGIFYILIIDCSISLTFFKSKVCVCGVCVCEQTVTDAGGEASV